MTENDEKSGAEKTFGNGPDGDGQDSTGFSIGATVLGAYAGPFLYPGAFIRAAWFPFLVSLVLSQLFAWLGAGWLAEGDSAAQAGRRDLLSWLFFAGYLPILLFFVSWSRHQATRGNLDLPWMPQLDRGHALLFLWTLLLLVIAIAVTLAFSTILILFGGLLASLLPNVFNDDQSAVHYGLWAGIAAEFMALLLICRLAPALPAAAAKEIWRLSESWRRSRGLTWRLFTIFLASILPFLALGKGMEILGNWLLQIGGPALAPAVSLGFQTLHLTLQYIMTAVLVGAFTEVYRQIGTRS